MTDHRWQKRRILILGLSLWLVAGLCHAASSPSHESYRLGSNDLVHIQVYGEEDLTVESKIDGDGSIHFPLLGVLHVAGKTIQELQEDLTTRLAHGYVRSPKVTAYIVRHRNFYVSGEVKHPGGYPYEEGLTVYKALSVAGGRTEKAEKGLLKLTRITGGMAETMAVTPETTMVPDDVIVVEADNHKFYASGEVKNPSGYPFKENLTVHKAIAMAGGLTEKAERWKFQVLRQVNGQEETVPVGLDSLVLPDDIIVVAEGQKFHIGGEVKTPGRYLYEKGMTIHKAVSMAGGWTEKAEKGSLKVTRMDEGGVVQPIDVDLDAPVLPNDFIVVPQFKKVYVDGEVKRAGDYPFERGLTVHKAITMAGGVTDKASVGSIKILRKLNGQEQTIPGTLDGVIMPEDIIVVPRSFF